MRHPGGMIENFRSGGMSDDFCPGGMSYATRRKGDVYVSKREEATWQFLERSHNLEIKINK